MTMSNPTEAGCRVKECVKWAVETGFAGGVQRVKTELIVFAKPSRRKILWQGKWLACYNICEASI
jgi:hypothetical protein